MLPTNFVTLHEQEENIRAQSMEFLAQNSPLKDHIEIIHASMDHVFALIQQHEHANEAELTVPLLGIRLFNISASSLKLALAGYYQNAFSVARDILEITNLLDYFLTWPDQISVWQKASAKERWLQFGPATIRKALDNRDGYEGKRREEIYKQFSEYASHASYPGFKLIAPDGLGKIGPFFDVGLLKAWIEEMAKRLPHATLILSLQMKEKLKPDNENMFLQILQFLSVLEKWRKQYIPLPSEQALEA